MKVFLRRLNAAIEAGRNAAAFSRALNESDRSIKISEVSRPSGFNIRPQVLALVLGQDAKEATINVQSVIGIAKMRDSGVVLITDNADINIFRIVGCVTEYLPSLLTLSATNTLEDSNQYLQNRFGILMKKWSPIQTITFGPISMAFYTKWRVDNALTVEL